MKLLFVSVGVTVCVPLPAVPAGLLCILSGLASCGQHSALHFNHPVLVESSGCCLQPLTPPFVNKSVIAQFTIAPVARLET